MNRYKILDYLRQHPGEENTVRLLSDSLNLTISQTRCGLYQLEYMKLVDREAKMIVQWDGVERKNFVYSAIFKGKR
jgi:DNA-binding MarR family transcriptional regulator